MAWSFSALVAADLRRNARRGGPAGFVFALLLNPSFQACFLHRLAHCLEKGGPIGRLLARIVWRGNVALSASYISRSAIVGPAFGLPHPTGVVIGEGCRIGDNVTIYQNVTLGAKQGDILAYPLIEDDVTIYAGAVLIGPIRIGRGAVIGANAVVMTDVPSDAVAVGVPARIIEKTKPEPVQAVR